MRVGSLFSGIGGIALGLERAGMEIIWQVEIGEYEREVLARHWPNARRYGDVRSVHGPLAHAAQLTSVDICGGRENIRSQGEASEHDGCQSCLPPVDLICGGPPCQPVSHAGRRLGERDDRYLWPEMLRVVRELRPRYVLFENVFGLLTHEGGVLLARVSSDLEDAGYEVLPPVVLPAVGLGAPHRRDRVFVVAHTSTSRCTRSKDTRTDRSDAPAHE